MSAEQTGVDRVEPRATPFYDALVDCGVEFDEYGGYLWPGTFGDVEAEYRAQREDVGMADASPIHKWDFRGRDAIAAAQRLLTNTVTGEPVGRVRYGGFCDADGRMVDDGTVFILAEDHAWVMTNKDTRAEHFARWTSGLDVEVEFLTPRLPHLLVQGPRSRAALAEATKADLSALEYFWFIPKPIEVAGIPVFLSRTGVSELGYELFCRPQDAADLFRRIHAATGARPYGLRAMEVVRVEAGVIVVDADYPEHVRTPYDLSLDKLVDLKRDFVGRDALAAIAEGPRQRRLTTVLLDGNALPEPGAPLSRDGERVGTLTSPARSFYLERPIAMAIVDEPAAQPRTRLEVPAGGERVGAQVSDRHPVYDPEKKRPRM